MLLIVGGVWTVLTVVVLTLLQPMLRLSVAADRRQEEQVLWAAGDVDWPDDLGARRAGRVELELSRALQTLNDSGRQPEVAALMRALAVADGYTWEHSLEVAELAGRVGRRLGLSAPQLVEVHLAALLHDVGKTRLPRHILRKPGALNPEEWRLVRRHPELGAVLVANVPGLEAVADIVLSHHERPDGRGYPFGLVGDQIPLASRIVSACDAFEAISGGRPYREALDTHSAIEELQRAAGTQFDADVVDALAAISAERQPVSA